MTKQYIGRDTWNLMFENKNVILHENEIATIFEEFRELDEKFEILELQIGELKSILKQKDDEIKAVMEQLIDLTAEKQ